MFLLPVPFSACLPRREKRGSRAENGWHHSLVTERETMHPQDVGERCWPHPEIDWQCPAMLKNMG